MFTEEAKQGWIVVYDIMSRTIQKAMSDFKKENGIDGFIDFAIKKDNDETDNKNKTGQ